MKVLPSIAFNDFSGSAGDVTAKATKTGTVLTVRPFPSKVTSSAQKTKRNSLSAVSRAYRNLNDDQMAGWAALAEHMKGISTFGEAAKMTAHNAFVRINTNRALAGMSPLSTAPVYTSDVPEVDYDDFWVTPERIIFVGLNQPSEHHRLVMKMSRTESTGVSSGWGNTVIVAPAFSPDWGDADITQSYLSTIGFLPVAGQKYFLSFWWMDTETGFTGESMAVSVICQELSVVKKELYSPRKRIVDSDLAEGGSVSGLDFEFSPASGVLSVNASLRGKTGYASSECETLEQIDTLPAGNGMLLARSSEETGFQPQTYVLWLAQPSSCTRLTFARRGGKYEKPSETDCTSVFYA